MTTAQSYCSATSRITSHSPLRVDSARSCAPLDGVRPDRDRLDGCQVGGMAWKELASPKGRGWGGVSVSTHMVDPLLVWRRG